MFRSSIAALLLTFALPPAAIAQNWDEVGGYIGMADSVIQRVFGTPDEVDFLDEKEALIWTYFLPAGEGRAASGPRPVGLPQRGVAAFSLFPGRGEGPAASGHRQFALWNGRVAAFSLLQYGPEAEGVYRSAAAFLDETASWFGRGTQSEHNRITRLGDNVWLVDKQAEGQHSEAVVRVGDAGYMMCSKARISELRRVKAKFGLDLK